MGVWLVECSEEELTELWDEWLNYRYCNYSKTIRDRFDSLVYVLTEVSRYNTFTGVFSTPGDMFPRITPDIAIIDPDLWFGKIDDHRTLIRFEIHTTRFTKYIISTIIAILVVVLFFSTHYLFYILAFPIRYLGFCGAIIALLLGFVYVIIIIMPSAILYSLSNLFTWIEAEFITLLELSGKDIYPVADPPHFALFPGDFLLIIQMVLLPLAFSFTIWIGNIDFWLIFTPFLLFYLLQFLRQAVTLYTHNKLVHMLEIYEYWRARATILSGLSNVFVVAGGSYLVLSLFQKANFNATFSYFKAQVVPNISLSEAILLVPRGFQLLFEIPNTSYSIALASANEHIPQHIVTSIGIFMLAITAGSYWILLSILKKNITLYKLWKESSGNIQFGNIPLLRVHSSSSILVHFMIILNWLIVLLQSLVGLLAIILAITWIVCDASIRLLEENSLLLGWYKPFLWYQSSIEATFGSTLGWFIARICILIITLPGILWLWMNIHFIFRLCLKCFDTTNKKNDHYFRFIFKELYQDLHIPSPQFILDDTNAYSANTTIFLPSSHYNAITISIYFAIVVAERHIKQLQAIIGHELGHVVLHSKRLWYTQLFSVLSLLGPGYLTLLLDFWNMELEADAFALKAIKDPQPLEDLLRDEEILKLRAQRLFRQRSPEPIQYRPTWLDRWSAHWTLIAELRELYQFYFDPNATIWGYLRPSSEERIEQLRRQWSSAANQKVTTNDHEIY